MIPMRKNADFTKVLKRGHERKWVALSKDRHSIIDSAADLPQLREKLGKKKDDVVYMKVLPSDIEFAFLLIRIK